MRVRVATVLMASALGAAVGGAVAGAEGGAVDAAVAGSVAGAADAPADLILTGGTIYTLADDRPSPVEALAIRAGAVIAAGTAASIQPLRAPSTRVVELAGAYALPGLVDAHGHLFNLGNLLSQVDLRGTRSAQECVERAKAFAAQLPADAWLLGRGWDQNDWPERADPRRELLDAAFGNRPVYLRRVDGHAGWANSAALRRAGITAATRDPQGGEIQRDPVTREPTGILIDTANDSLRAHLPAISDAELDHRLDLALASAARAGLTGVHEMGVMLPQLRALERAEAQGRLRVRVVALLAGDAALSQYVALHPEGPRRPAPASHLRVDAVKLYADGALGSRGAALLEDYSDRPGHRGLLIVPADTLRAAAARAMRHGFPVAIHAIGDRGNRVALDALEAGYRDAQAQRTAAKLAALPPLGELRCRVEHAQVLSPQDIPRFARLGIIASVQPTHCTSDMPWAPQRLGNDRIAGAYAWRTLLDSGAQLALGSDFPVEEVSPLLGLYAARTRRPLPDAPGAADAPAEGWAPRQCLSAMEAVLGFTAWAARAAGVPEWGRLAVGCRGDITVLDADPFAADAARLLATHVVQTFVEGKSESGAPAR